MHRRRRMNLTLLRKQMDPRRVMRLLRLVVVLVVLVVLLLMLLLLLLLLLLLHQPQRRTAT